MSLYAPLRVPVEIRRGERWFPLASQVGTEGLLFDPPLAAELEGRYEVQFVLPSEKSPIACRAQRQGEAMVFLDLESAEKERIERYVLQRLGIG